MANINSGTGFAEPILFLIFNRLDVTKKVFEVIREMKPNKLYVAGDGFRKHKPGEQEICLAVRNFVLDNIDWQCCVQTLFREENLGCKNAVSSAISWFFDHEERGIILEDDCLPSYSFFRFCSELLEKHKYNNEVMAITGYNGLQQFAADDPASYHYSCYFHCWGWATWRRAWSGYDKNMGGWKSFKKNDGIGAVQRGLLFKLYWTAAFDDVYSGKIDTWDYQMSFLIWKNKGLCCTPTKNLVSNIGFGPDATHTKDNTFSGMQKFDINFPLTHPDTVKRNVAMDKLETKFIYKITLLPVLAMMLRRNRFIKSIVKRLFK